QQHPAADRRPRALHPHRLRSAGDSRRGPGDGSVHRDRVRTAETMAAKKGRSRKKNRGRATPASPAPANRAAAASATAATRDRDARPSVSERLPALDPELRDRLLLALLT